MTDAVASAPTGTGRPPRLTSGLTTTSRRRSRNWSPSRAPSGPAARTGTSPAALSVELRLDLELQDVVPPERAQPGPSRALDGDVVGAQEDVVGQAVDHRRREAEDAAHVQDRHDARLELAV